MQVLRLQHPGGDQVAVDLVAGSGPAYLYVHGYASVRAGEKSSSLFEHARRRGRAAARIDLRGHGESSGLIGHVTMSEMVADVQLALEHLHGIGAGPVVLVGSSIGAVVASFAAARDPARVRGLVLLGPAFGFMRLASRLDPEGKLRTSTGLEVRMHARTIEDAARHDESALPGRLSMPLLLVHGTADEIIPYAVSERFFAQVPHTDKELWLVPGGDHRLNQPIAEVWRRMDARIG
ncbi:MAG: hypothetical protein RL148_2300 [Planctomycetota bacterium]|jgi:alpha-beta hydrolase superfamily lysophospholipase